MLDALDREGQHMPLSPALKDLIAQKLANTKVPQWDMPIGQVREAFANLWTPR